VCQCDPRLSYWIAARVGRVLFNPPSRMERRVKENPPYEGVLDWRATNDDDEHYCFAVAL